ncbi:CCR4-NOT transcription complex subunit 10-like, partial [Sinocyclocheilus anshuiensis]|uniref:CCR4-NOT transcription complex subunit 10-like n=1 Tax=Sinocyclocheilus anshuiensis TaxID=1608454 RepID=UPI0007BA65A9
MKHDSISSPGISDQEKETASNAFEAFKAGSYDESLKHLDSLQELNKEDYKITINKAITEFYKSGQTTTSTLKQTLMTLKNQMHTAVDDIDGLDDVENSILYYNQAVIHYHMRQYSEAISIGEKLYQFLEPF